MAMQEVLNDVGFERVRQEDLRRSGKFLWTCAVSGALVSLDRKMSVLSEEVGEVAKEVVDIGIARDKYDKEKMAFPRHRESALLLRIRKELVQVAAVCVAWIEAIDQDLDRLEQKVDSGVAGVFGQLNMNGDRQLLREVAAGVQGQINSMSLTPGQRGDTGGGGEAA